ncbi:hypothetical protein HSRCO_1805 [Halanaeroarchaeum sp. HSR-CO]|uniref:hypothetical protein n=1 Tax=Halanaeroarchaeum sp. HSR-CO TaxID=2866382 RepID=UPI00217E2041|nr:hypothetical protein [Halanaeroarchaeum sp. HSR-CO]UWG48082.1 hypothetical protein HSRCO_1805 [Halanaeroarchaeum sp. HSR-CO]
MTHQHHLEMMTSNTYSMDAAVAVRFGVSVPIDRSIAGSATDRVDDRPGSSGRKRPGRSWAPTEPLGRGEGVTQ